MGGMNIHMHHLFDLLAGFQGLDTVSHYRSESPGAKKMMEREREERSSENGKRKPRLDDIGRARNEEEAPKDKRQERGQRGRLPGRGKYTWYRGGQAEAKSERSADRGEARYGRR